MQSKFDITQFTFLGAQVLLEPLREESVNGLVKPEQYDDKSEFGTVLKVGQDVVDLLPGDTIFYGKYSTESVRVSGVDYLIIHAEDIKAVLYATHRKPVPAGTQSKAASK